jgi:hypothetical protein
VQTAIVAVIVAAYAAVVATVTLLLGQFRTVWRDHHPVKVQLAHHYVVLYSLLADAQVANRWEQLTLECVNTSDFPQQIDQVGFVPRQGPFARPRNRTKAVVLWPVVSGQLPAEVQPYRRWSTNLPWQQVPMDTTKRIKAYVELNDGRRASTRRRRIRRERPPEGWDGGPHGGEGMPTSAR